MLLSVGSTKQVRPLRKHDGLHEPVELVRETQAACWSHRRLSRRGVAAHLGPEAQHALERLGLTGDSQCDAGIEHLEAECLERSHSGRLVALVRLKLSERLR